MRLKTCRDVLVVAFGLCLASASAVELYNNGPLLTHVGAGFGGANVSAIQTQLGSQMTGYGVQWPGNNHLADDFVVPAGGWVIDTVTLYTYQMNTGTTPTTWDIRCRIWRGRPDEQGSQVVWGNLTTNRLIDSAFSGMYRARLDNMLASDRAIMVHSVNLGVSLSEGTYWLEWSAQGMQSTGPWAPPVTRQGQAGSGNAMEYYGSDLQWHSLQDTMTGWTDDVPFILYGPAPGGLQNVPASSYSIGPGGLISGLIGDLATSNDVRMNFRPGAVLVSSQKPLVVVLEGTLPGSTASQLQFVLESSATTANILQEIEVFNFSTNQYDPVGDSRVLQTVDQSVQLGIANPNQHIGPGNKARVRISGKAGGAVLVYPWLLRMDQAIWRYSP